MAESESNDTHPVYVSRDEKREVKRVAFDRGATMRDTTELFTRAGRLLRLDLLLEEGVEGENSDEFKRELVDHLLEQEMVIERLVERGDFEVKETVEE